MSASSVGLEFGIAVILGLAFGNWLDNKVGSTPWLTLLFLGFGFAAGMKGIFRAVRRADREAAQAEEGALAGEAAKHHAPPTEHTTSAGIATGTSAAHTGLRREVEP